MGRRSAGWMVALAATAMVGVPGGVAGRDTQASKAVATVTLAPDADARVTQAYPDVNYGSSTWLRAAAAANAEIQSYLRFTVSDSTVQRATLRLYSHLGTADGPAVYGTSTGWTESGITWNNRPGPTTGLIADTGAIAANTWVEYDVTSLVSGSGSFGFVLVGTSADGVEFYSRESSDATLVPQLVVETTSPSAGTVVVAGAGDIASCTSTGDEATARVLDTVAPTRVLTFGDNAYPDGTSAQFKNCYGPSWGRHKANTSPSVGNHDYHVAGAAGYFGYFGAAAGASGKGYYAFDLGTWRLYALNSNCTQVGGCSAGSPQERWFRGDLAAHPHSCALAFMHHPRFSSGMTGLRRDNSNLGALYKAFYDARGDIWLVGHNHFYERLTHLDPTGTIDMSRGIRNFVVGTGGASHGNIGTAIRGSEVRNSTAFGVLRLTLRAGGYDWRFMPAAGATFTDSGSDTCR